MGIHSLYLRMSDYKSKGRFRHFHNKNYSAKLKSINQYDKLVTFPQVADLDSIFHPELYKTFPNDQLLYKKPNTEIDILKNFGINTHVCTSCFKRSRVKYMFRNGYKHPKYLGLEYTRFPGKGKNKSKFWFESRIDDCRRDGLYH